MDPKPDPNRLRIQAPCPARWETMEGDEKQRFCAQCSLHVHNIAELRRRDVQELMQARSTGNERLCIRLQKTSTGQTLTRDDRYERLLTLLHKHAQNTTNTTP